MAAKDKSSPRGKPAKKPPQQAKALPEPLSGLRLMIANGWGNTRPSLLPRNWRTSINVNRCT